MAPHVKKKQKKTKYFQKKKNKNTQRKEGKKNI
jgi:hypothetical protein